uniref:Uncharacterized protein n=1 Tax=Oryza glumipatula TaxID=40148 RepID=A0A0E0AXV8_9ORYZ
MTGGVTGLGGGSARTPSFFLAALLSWRLVVVIVPTRPTRRPRAAAKTARLPRRRPLGPTLLSYPSSSSHTRRSGGTAREQRDGPSRTVSVDGFLSGGGGGFGLMLRKHGLASDLIVDATMVNAEGEAPQQGRHGGGPLLGHPRRQRRELLRVVVQNQNAQFESLYLVGTRLGLVAAMADTFPELGVTASDCIKMMWIQSVLYFAFYGTGKPLEMLLDRGTSKPDKYLKAKSDSNMPSQVWETTWSWLLKDGAGLLILDPYGGEMVHVAPVVTPFPHRQALYNIQYYGFWSKSGAAATEKHMGWIRGLYGEMEPQQPSPPSQDLSPSAAPGAGEYGSRGNLNLSENINCLKT